MKYKVGDLVRHKYDDTYMYVINKLSNDPDFPYEIRALGSRHNGFRSNDEYVGDRVEINLLSILYGVPC